MSQPATAPASPATTRPTSPRPAHHDILFQPLKIGPRTAKNRFYQVPHCNGMGHRDPSALAGMRGMKAAGGWAVVCTEEVEIHPASEVSPALEGRIWSDDDIPLHARVVDAIHEHGGLAGCELVYNAPRTNLVSRLPAMGVTAGPVISEWREPRMARAMDLDDIRAVRRWHRNAALRAKAAGYDLVYVYAGHGLTLTQTFLSRATNQRSDAYGGSLENRMRLLRELIEETKDAVGDRCAVPVRIAVAEDHERAFESGQVEGLGGRGHRHPYPAGGLTGGQEGTEVDPGQTQRGPDLVGDHDRIVPTGQLGQLGQLGR